MLPLASPNRVGLNYCFINQIGLFEEKEENGTIIHEHTSEGKLERRLTSRLNWPKSCDMLARMSSEQQGEKIVIIACCFTQMSS